MKIKNVELIIQHINDGNYIKHCSLYCCLPFYYTKFVFDLSFFSNKVNYLQSLFCGCSNNYEPIK